MIQQSVHDAVLVDEAGIEVGCFGAYRLRSAYRPVFRRAGDQLQAVAAEALTLAAGEEPGAAGIDLPVAEEVHERRFLAELSQALHIANYRNLDLPPCDLIVGHDLLRNRQLIETVAEAQRHAGMMGLDAAKSERIICRIADDAALASSDSLQLAAELRDRGFRIAIDLFTEMSAAAELVPDIVELSGPWTARIAREPAAVGLLHQVVERHRADGARLLASGLEAREHLQLALSIGADYLAGDLLGLPIPAGVCTDLRPRRISDLVGTSAIAESAAREATILPFQRLPLR